MFLMFKVVLLIVIFEFRDKFGIIFFNGMIFVVGNIVYVVYRSKDLVNFLIILFK